MIFIVILYFIWLLHLFIVGDNCMFHVKHKYIKISTCYVCYYFRNINYYKILYFLNSMFHVKHDLSTDLLIYNNYISNISIIIVFIL